MEKGEGKCKQNVHQHLYQILALEKDQHVSFVILWNVKCDLILDLPSEECPMP